VEVRVRGRLSCRRSLAIAAVVVALGGASCTDDAPSTEQDPNERLIEIYSVTVTELVEEAGALPSVDDEGKAEELTTVFLQAREETEINAEVQVGVVNELAGWANVRFIDDVAEAVDGDVDGAPVRDDGTLIGLGTVGDGEVAAELVADRYVSDEETMVYDVSLQRRGGEWSVVEPLEAVPVGTP
jgi:hypothetical protein